MYSMGSARLPSIDGIASLRHTRRLRRQTCMKRRLSCGSGRDARMSSTKLRAGQLEEQIVEVRGPVQVTQSRLAVERMHERVGIVRVAEHRLAGARATIALAAPEAVGPALRPV